MVPSDRDITRAVNEGTAIVISKPKSGAATAFSRLAGMYQPQTVTTTDDAPAAEGRRLLRRKG